MFHMLFLPQTVDLLKLKW